MSHSLICVRLGREPRSPTCCVWYGTSEGTTSLPRSAVMMPAPVFSAASSTRSVAPRAPRSDEERHALPGVQDLGEAGDLVLRRDDAGRRGDVARPGHPVLGGRCLVRHRLHVVGEHDDRRLLPEHRGAERRVDDDTDRVRRGDGLHVAGDVGEHALEVRLLLGERPDRCQALLPDDRDDRLVVHLRVVQAVEQVERAGARGRDADPDLAGELRVRGRHQRGDLLVRRADVLELAFAAVGLAERPVERADPVARVAEDARDAPCLDAVDDEVAHGRAHAPTVLGRSCTRSGPLARRNLGRSSQRCTAAARR